jgi:hypothetical protein
MIIKGTKPHIPGPWPIQPTKISVMQPELTSLLAALDGELARIRQIAERFGDATTDANTGAALISHRPAIGAEAFACVLFPGITPDALIRYEAAQRLLHRDFEIPEIYKSVLLRLNGAVVFGMHLFGVPLTMVDAPPLLDRSSCQPLDLGTANTSWRKRYAPRPSQFQFGSAPYSKEENTAHFLNEDGTIEALLPGGRQFSSWSSLESFLSAELARAEAFFDEFHRKR